MLIRFLILSPTLLFLASRFRAPSAGIEGREVGCCGGPRGIAEGRRRDAMLAGFSSYEPLSFQVGTVVRREDQVTSRMSLQAGRLTSNRFRGSNPRGCQQICAAGEEFMGCLLRNPLSFR